jgi:formamidopyrimidine-DNA glycosylase
MPELPEVETIARALREGGRNGESVLGKRIISADLFWNRTLAEPGVDEFLVRIQGQSIHEARRRAKFLVLRLGKDSLLIHLRMSGDLRVESEHVAPQRHDRLVLHLSEGLRLAFNDPRKFGRIWLLSDVQSVLGQLGPEPLDPALTGEIFHAALQRVHRQIKPLLLDQSFLAGVGNIYSDEALHLAKIHPLRSSDSINREEAGLLLQAIRAVLNEGIKRNGASIDWVYRGGDFQNHFRVYQKTGQACPICGTPIEKKMIGQRSSHYCPSCQPLI